MDSKAPIDPPPARRFSWLSVVKQASDRPRIPASVTSVRVVFWSTLVLTGFAIAAVAWFLVDPAPPARIKIATGIEDGFYDRLGRRFALRLRQERVEVDLVPTAGSAENIDLLRASDVDAAFVQGGVGSPPPRDTHLRSLAALAIEPLWIFSRGVDTLSGLDGREDLRIAIGSGGSGTRQLMMHVLALTGLAGGMATEALDGAAAAAALRDGTVDLAAFVTSPQTLWVHDLLRDPAIRLVEMDYADALTRRLPFASRVDLPARAIDIVDKVPAEDTSILGVATVLLVRESLHPAIKQLMLQISTMLARGDPVLGTRGQFPSADLVEYPLDTEAERYFRYGPTPARRYLPYWAANLFERFWVLMIPIATLLIPILRFGPTTLQWSIRRRIYRWYRDLKDLEGAALDASTETELKTVLDGLHEVERQVSVIRVPLAFRDDLYRLRMHVAFVRAEVTQNLAR